jgi:hypothetical protein
MKLQICTEADYLQAHLTVIVGGSRRRNPSFRNLKQLLTSKLKKWIAAASANSHFARVRRVLDHLAR